MWIHAAKEYNRRSYGGKKFHRTGTRKRKIVIMTSLNVKGAINAAGWASVIKGLKVAKCIRNLYYISKGHFSQRNAVMTANNISLERRVTIGCSQGSCCGTGF